MMPRHTLAEDITALANDLITAFSLTFEQTEAHLSDPLLRWLDFRLRYVDPKPRTITESTGFASRVPPVAVDALNAFIDRSVAGIDLNPYLTKTVRSNDTSGVKRQTRTDGLWAEWSIHHAHLSTHALHSGEKFSLRSDWLLFFIVADQQLGLIDVRSHGEKDVFQAIDLVEKAIRSWPAFGERFALQSPVMMRRSLASSTSEIKQLRKAGITQILQVDGKAYISPGLGLSTASTSTRSSLQLMRVKRLARAIGETFASTENEATKLTQSKGVFDPVFSLMVLPSGKLAVSCAAIDTCWPFPNEDTPNSEYSELQRIMLPDWAAAAMPEGWISRVQDQ